MKSCLSVVLLVLLSVMSSSQAPSDLDARGFNLAGIMDAINGLKDGVRDGLKIARDLGFLKVKGKRSAKSIESAPATSLEPRFGFWSDFLGGFQTGVRQGLKVLKTVSDITGIIKPGRAQYLSGNKPDQPEMINENLSEALEKGIQMGQDHMKAVIEMFVAEAEKDLLDAHITNPEYLSVQDEFDLSLLAGRSGFWGDFVTGFKKGMKIAAQVAQAAGTIAIFI